MRFPWYKIAWRVLWAPALYLTRFVFCIVVGIMHLDPDMVEKAWEVTA
jgi:hypothetical protein